jgi:hypothetical protein
MRFACCAVLLLAYGLVTGRTQPTFDLPGHLELVDRPPEATPVEAMMVSLHPLVLDYDVQARPDRDGKFVLKNVKPGRYSLTLPFPGRIRTFCHRLQRTHSRWVRIGFGRWRAPTNRCQLEDIHSVCEGAWVSKPTWRYRSSACSRRPILDASRIVLF